MGPSKEFILSKKGYHAHTEHFSATRVPLVLKGEMIFHMGMRYYSVEIIL